jgi:hypothetical protein
LEKRKMKRGGGEEAWSLKVRTHKRAVAAGNLRFLID